MYMLLTKNDCNYCNQFKTFLKFSSVGKKNADKVSILNRDTLEDSEQEKTYEEYFEAAITQGASSFPILLDENKKLLMTGFDSSKAIKILGGVK